MYNIQSIQQFNDYKSVLNIESIQYNNIFLTTMKDIQSFLYLMYYPFIWTKNGKRMVITNETFTQKENIHKQMKTLETELGNYGKLKAVSEPQKDALKNIQSKYDAIPCKNNVLQNQLGQNKQTVHSLPKQCEDRRKWRHRESELSDSENEYPCTQ
eukprot:1151938_1